MYTRRDKHISTIKRVSSPNDGIDEAPTCITIIVLISCDNRLHPGSYRKAVGSSRQGAPGREPHTDLGPVGEGCAHGGQEEETDVYTGSIPKGRGERQVLRQDVTQIPMGSLTTDNARTGKQPSPRPAGMN